MKFELAPTSNPIEDSVPRRLLDPEDLVGETVRIAIPTDGRHGVSMVVVFESDSWVTLACRQDDPEEPGVVDLSSQEATPGDSPSKFLNANELLDARLINRAQHDFLSKAEAEAERKTRMERAKRLRKMAEELDPSTATES